MTMTTATGNLVTLPTSSTPDQIWEVMRIQYGSAFLLEAERTLEPTGFNDWLQVPLDTLQLPAQL